MSYAFTLQPEDAASLVQLLRRFAHLSEDGFATRRAHRLADYFGARVFEKQTYHVSASDRTFLLEHIAYARAHTYTSGLDDAILRLLARHLETAVVTTGALNPTDGFLYIPMNGDDAHFLSEVCAKWRHGHRYDAGDYAEKGIYLHKLVNWLRDHSHGTVRLSVRYAELFDRILTDALAWRNDQRFRKTVQTVGLRLTEILATHQPVLTLEPADAFIVRRALHTLSSDPTHGAEYRRVAERISERL